MNIDKKIFNQLRLNCKEIDCTLSEYLDALTYTLVIEEIKAQIEFNRIKKGR